MTATFERVQQYTELGYVCIPVNVTLDDRDKKQVDAPRDWPSRTFDRPEDWEGWTGIAFDCGRSGIVAVDIDTSHGKDGIAGLSRAGIKLTPTPASLITQSGGLHGIYRACSIPLRDSVSKLADDVDVKAFGLLITAPTSVTPEREYRWRDGVVAVGDLPEFPEDLARLLAESESKFTAAPVEFTPADVTPEQREWALQRIDYKLQEIADAGAGGNWEASKALMRIFGLAKTIGEDLESIAEKCLAASRDDDEDRFIGSVARAMRNAKPEDPAMWTPEGRRRAFWDRRPELAHIKSVAVGATASPWAVLGAVLVRVLADVPPLWVMDTGISVPPQGNLNMFAVLTAHSGGGKGIATETAEYLWRCDDTVYTTDAASGEGLAKLFANRDGNTIRTSVIVDIDEYASLRAASDRSGSTLSFKLSSCWSGKRLSMAYADETKSFQVPAGSYRLGLIAGVQYGNAKLLLSADDQIQGYTNRFVWFPAEIDYDTSKVGLPTELPARLRRVTFPAVHKTISVPEQVKSTIRAARSAVDSGLDGHKLYAQAKMAYALAVLNGRTDSIHDEDWELSQIVMEMSNATRAKARDAMRSRAREEHESRGEADGIRQSVAEDTAHERAVRRVANWITRKREEVPSETDAQLRERSASRDRKGGLFEEALDLLLTS